MDEHEGDSGGSIGAEEAGDDGKKPAIALCSGCSLARRRHLRLPCHLDC